MLPQGVFFFCVGVTIMSSRCRVQLLFIIMITAYKDISTPQYRNIRCVILLVVHLYICLYTRPNHVLKLFHTRLAQSVERQPFKLVVEGSSPSSGDFWRSTTAVVSFCSYSSVGQSVGLMSRRSAVRPRIGAFDPNIVFKLFNMRGWPSGLRRWT